MDKIILTPCGEVRGTENKADGVTAFKGIRYAVADRWAYPEKVTQWQGIYDATNEANSHGNFESSGIYLPRGYVPR